LASNCKAAAGLGTIWCLSVDEGPHPREAKRNVRPGHGAEHACRERLRNSAVSRGSTTPTNDRRSDETATQAQAAPSRPKSTSQLDLLSAPRAGAIGAGFAGSPIWISMRSPGAKSERPLSFGLMPLSFGEGCTIWVGKRLLPCAKRWCCLLNERLRLSPAISGRYQSRNSQESRMRYAGYGANRELPSQRFIWSRPRSSQRFRFSISVWLDERRYGRSRPA